MQYEQVFARTQKLKIFEFEQKSAYGVRFPDEELKNGPKLGGFGGLKSIVVIGSQQSRDFLPALSGQK